MKKNFLGVCILAVCIMLLVLTGCQAEKALPQSSFLSETPQKAQAPFPSASQAPPPAISHETAMPAPSVSPEDAAPEGTEDEAADEYGSTPIPNGSLDEYQKEQVAEAKKFRAKIGDCEYFFDTKRILQMDYSFEFPLCLRDKEGYEDYMGTTGFEFQACGQFIYLKSDILQEDYPIGEMTRVINTKTGTITPFARNMEIFIPEKSKKIYYTFDIDDHIYIADPSLKRHKSLHIKIPERKVIQKKYGEGFKDLCADITISKVEKGWIYFLYHLFEYEGPGIYEGNYRITLNGRHIEKTDAGKFIQENSEDTDDTEDTE